MNGRYIIALLFMCFPILSFGQDWEVINFKEDPLDISARTKERKDYNDNPCALIKIAIESTDLKFSDSSPVVGDVKRDNGYWYVYVPEHTRYLTIESLIPIEIDFRDYDIYPKQKVTYVLTLKKKEPNRKSANLKALAMSIIPGVGLIQKGRTVEGIGYLIGDVALIGGGIGLDIYANNQKKIMNDRNTTLDAYKKAKSNYDSAKTGSYICYGAAGAVYVLNLVRSYVARPRPGAPLQWAFSTGTAPGINAPGSNNLTFNISLCYTF